MSGLLVGDVFANAARAVPDRVAVVVGQRTLTFGELDAAANRVARALGADGVRPRDRAVVLATTSLELVPVFAAAAKLGAVFAPANPSLPTAEAVDMVKAARPRLVVTADERPDIAGAVDAPVITIDELMARAAREPAAAHHAAGFGELDPHVVFFTSGSTGRSKGAVISHRVNYLRTHPGALLEPRGAMVCPYPLFHMGAWTIALQQWQARDRTVFVERADAALVVDAVERHRATRLNCVPAVWYRILDLVGGQPARELSSVRFADTGTSATPVELLTGIKAAFPNAGVRVFYGSTEAGSVATLEDADVTRKPGSCGVPAPGAELRLGEDGELCVRGPHLFDGYFDDPDATAAAIVDGWYHTGDLADMDDEGYLTIVGRVRDVVRTGGETVSPAEVEAVLLGHPAVEDVAVVGLPDPEFGETVCAVVVVAPGAVPPDVAELRGHCASRLARFKQPRQVALVDAIPRTAATGQVQRRLLVERLSSAAPPAR
ncbi:MAG: acyl--CoA ligase [Actinobacteria bacterium]|nr:acyl--CoA ligase [Actinomycetota bacterium]